MDRNSFFIGYGNSWVHLWSEALLCAHVVHGCCQALRCYDSVCCLPHAKLKQISDSHKLFFREENSSTLHLPTNRGTCSHFPMPSPHCHLRHLLPITRCLGSSSLLLWKPVNIPNVFHTDESAAVHHREKERDIPPEKNGQQHNKEGRRRELVGELQSRDGLPWLKGHPARLYCSISQCNIISQRVADVAVWLWKCYRGNAKMLRFNQTAKLDLDVFKFKCLPGGTITRICAGFTCCQLYFLNWLSAHHCL